MSYDPQREIQIARAYADMGYHEGPNNRNDFSFWQYGAYHNPWCDSFASYCAWQAGYRFPGFSACGDKGDYNVGSHHQHAVRTGTWRGPDYHARTGDLVIFNFTEPDQHIEIVDVDGGPWLDTIGGNTGDMVARRHRFRANVVGFDALTQAGQSAPIPAPVPVRLEETMLFKPPGGDKTLNRFTGAKVDPAAARIDITGDCTCSPSPDGVTIQTPWLGAFGPERDPKLTAGQFVVVGADKAEFKFTLA